MRRFGRKLLLAGGSLLALGLLAEGTLRLFGYGKLLMYDTHPLLLWVPRPSQRCLSKVNLRRETVNAEGFRGAEISREKPSGVFRVACLGDSVTFGWGVSDAETYEAVLEGRLREGGLRCEVLNAGVNAYCANQEYVYLREKVLDYAPDLVTIGFSHNEGWQNFVALSPRERERTLSGVRMKNRLRHRFFAARFHEIAGIGIRHRFQKIREFEGYLQYSKRLNH
jgi:hypothetical protein